MKTLIERFMDKVIPEPNSGCWIWTGAAAGGGYGSFLSTTAHRSAYRIFRGEIPDGQEVCHKCDVRMCVNPDHLFLGTRSDNMQDCSRKGRIARIGAPKGWFHPRPNAKLTTEQVREISSLRGIKAAVLAKRFSVSRTAIENVWHRKQWKHVTN